MSIELINVDLRNESHIVLARRRARDIANLLGFDKQDCVRIATTVSEIARNAWRYAGGGRAEFRLLRENEKDIFEISIRDQGPGIANVDEILAGRYRSATGMGLGILSGRRLMDRFDIDTNPRGTVIRLGKTLPRRFADPLPVIASRISEGLVKLRINDSASEVEEQNRELLQTLATLEKNQAELTQLNRELEETNRGVVALYAELDDRAQEIQKVLDLKSRFLSNITHEFRTPLNSIIGLSRMLLERIDGELTTEQEKQTRFINRAARDLGDLVNDLLDLAKTDAGKVEVSFAPVSVGELFTTLRGMLRPLIEHNAAVALVFDLPLPDISIISDERKLSQVLRNLISNALKYTQAGEVQVSATIDERNIVFCVRDTGIGIPEKHQDKIFEEFYQVRNPLQQKIKGTGLGLALSRRLVDLLGGTISLKSFVGLGSSFYVNLPMAPVTTAAPEPTALPAASAPPDRDLPALVLFLDNRVEMLFNYERLLENTAFKAILARDEKEALNILKRVSVAAIVAPSSSEVSSLASALPLSTLQPAFIVTATASETEESSGIIDAFLPANPTADELVASLQTLISRPRPSVLIVDDSAEARKSLRSLLEEFQLTVFEADSVDPALALIGEHHPTVVFTEFAFPDQAGLAVISRFKHALEHGSLIVHSSQVFSDEQRESLKVSSFAFVRKGLPSESTYRTSIIHALAHAKRRHLRA